MLNSIRRAWDKLPLGSKLALPASLLVLVVAFLLTFFTIRREQETFRTELEEQAVILLETIALPLRDPLYRYELDELDDIGGIYQDNPNVISLGLYDRRGVLLIDATRDEPITFSQVVDPLGERLLTLERDEIYRDWQSDRLVAGRSVTVGNQTIGAVAVALATAPLDAKVAALTGQSIIIALVSSAGAAGLAFLLGRRITASLTDLTHAASAMSRGDLSARVREQGEDETGELARAFNQMIRAIQERETALRDLAASLEQQVGERTAELRQQNTALVKANKELTQARKLAEEATKLKSEFLATMSHELRTPLNAVIGYSQLIAEGISGDLTPRQKENVERILKNAQVLLDLINDILDLAKIEAGRLELVNKAFVLRDWIDDVYHQTESLAQAKGLRYSFKVDKALPSVIVSDPDRLRQIALNLVTNAIKFTDEGSVEVELNRHKSGAWALVVSDTGIGIPSHAQEYIFDEFRQVDGTSRRKHGGTGLGLSIVRNLAVMMGGNIRVKSKVGAGSTFTVVLPLATQEVPAVL